MSNRIETLRKIEEIGIVAVVRAESVEQAEKITDACIKGGVAAIELTFTVPHADKLIEAWARIPEVGEGLKTMPVGIARNTAINLDRQYNFMSNLKESQMATALNNFTPENMLRLVRLSMPNLIRNKVFTEVA